MIANTPMLTERGENLLLRAIAGEAMTFTRFKIGDGMLPDGEDFRKLEDLIHANVSFPVVGLDMTQKGFVGLTGAFDSGDVTEDFSWREMGIYARGEDGEEILYAYANDGEDAGMLRALNTEVLTEQEVTLIVAIGEAEHVTAVFSPRAQYALKEDFEGHRDNRDNPHGVTKEQVGLGNVPDAHPQDAAITFSTEKPDGVEEETLTSGETLRSLMGKLARNIAAFLEHVKNRDNPHGVTLESIGGAAEDHGHDAGDISTGVLPVERGGTGVDSLDGLKNLIGTNAQMGIYVGDGTVKRLVPLEFRPAAVILCNSSGMMGDSAKGVCGGMALGAYGLKSPASSLASHATTWDDDYTALLIDDAGFYVNHKSSDVPEEIIATNSSGETYYYIAYR